MNRFGRFFKMSLVALMACAVVTGCGAKEEPAPSTNAWGQTAEELASMQSAYDEMIFGSDETAAEDTKKEVKTRLYPISEEIKNSSFEDHLVQVRSVVFDLDDKITVREVLEKLSVDGPVKLEYNHVEITEASYADNVMYSIKNEKGNTICIMLIDYDGEDLVKTFDCTMSFLGDYTPAIACDPDVMYSGNICPWAFYDYDYVNKNVFEGEGISREEYDQRVAECGVNELTIENAREWFASKGAKYIRQDGTEFFYSDSHGMVAFTYQITFDKANPEQKKLTMRNNYFYPENLLEKYDITDFDWVTDQAKDAIQEAVNTALTSYYWRDVANESAAVKAYFFYPQNDGEGYYFYVIFQSDKGSYFYSRAEITRGYDEVIGAKVVNIASDELFESTEALLNYYEVDPALTLRMDE